MNRPLGTSALALLLAFAASACVGSRKLSDPVLSIQTEKGLELGVSTEYGVVFLGRTATSGRAEITAYFYDGPSIEPVVIEPIGGGLYTAETEIRLPEVPLSFEDPKPGSELTIIGRNDRDLWEAVVKVVDEPRALGLLTTIPAELIGHEEQTGAGVFLIDPDDSTQKRLVGLVSGVVSFQTRDGQRDYLTVVGPQDLWRLVTHRHELVKKRRWIYRDDIL